MIQAAFFDIDGTLIDPITHQIPASTIHALKALKKRMPIGIASGRDMKNILDIKVLDPTLFNGFVASNGMAIFDDQQSCICAHAFDSKSVETIIAFANEHHMTLVLETMQDIYCVNEVNAYVDIANAYYHESTPPYKPWQKEPVIKISCFQQLGFDFQPLLEQLDIVILPSPTTTYDINLRGISKLSGIHELMQHWGLPKDNFLCFGDHDNDMEMIQGAQIGVAVKDEYASKKLWELADDTCASPHEDGIYHYLKQHHYI